MKRITLSWLHIAPDEREKFFALLKAIVHLILHYSIDELQLLHDLLESNNESK
ncbi:MAG: hypothetical protein [Microvirus sp.]|nr:MAG: hypothetical protein [Microvirus sp.]